MKLSLLMKKKTEDFYESLKNSKGFYQALFSGNIRHETVQHFIESVRHLVAHTPVNLRLAAAEAKKRGLTDLAEFFELKIKEETGHDKWAESDLEQLAILAPTKTKSLAVASAIKKTIKYNQDIIKKDPVLYLVHIFFAEYFTVCDGPDFMRALADLGITPEMVSVVNNHVELDVEHVAEWEETLEQLVTKKEYEAAFLRCLDESFAFYEQFCDDLEKFNDDLSKDDRTLRAS